MNLLVSLLGMLAPVGPAVDAAPQAAPAPIVFNGSVESKQGDKGRISLEITFKGDRMRVTGGTLSVKGVEYRLQGLSYHPDGDVGHAVFQLFITGCLHMRCLRRLTLPAG